MKAILLMLGALSAAIIFVGCGTAVGRATGVSTNESITSDVISPSSQATIEMNQQIEALIKEVQEISEKADKTKQEIQKISEPEPPKEVSMSDQEEYNLSALKCELAREYGVPVDLIELNPDPGDGSWYETPDLTCDELLGLTSESAEAVEEALQEAEEERRQEEKRRQQEEEERVARQIQEAIETAAAEEADRNNLLQQECWAISENNDEPLMELVRLFEDCISEHPDAEELTEEFWEHGSQSGWGAFGGTMMQEEGVPQDGVSYAGQQGQDDGGDGWVDNAGNEGGGDDGDGGWGGTVCDGWGGCDMTLQEGVDEIRDRVSELEELIRELTEALQPN